MRIWTLPFVVVTALLSTDVAVRAQVRRFPLSGPTDTTARPAGVNGPLPALLGKAHSVFLSNAGADAGLFPHPFTGTQDRAYAQFYSAIAKSGRFTMASEPRDADLVMEFSLLAPMGPQGDNKQNGTTDPLPEFKVVIYDRESHYVLWTLSQTIDPAERQRTHDANFDTALAAMVQQLMLVVAK